MISYINGILTYSSPTYVIIEAAGVGYKIFTTALTYAKLPEIQTNCKLHTVHVVREQSQALYGFLQPHACELFENLINISGIGPKIAMSILGHMSEGDLLNAISMEDVTSLSKIPGIGKKTAQRLIIEMRDKSLSSHDTFSAATFNHDNGYVKMAVNALINLGYSQPIAHKAVQKSVSLKPNIDLPALIAEALNHT